jgi:hypothetical protein
MGGIRKRVSKLEVMMDIGGSRRLLTETEAERLQDLEKKNEQGNVEGRAYLDLLFLRLKASGVRLSTRVLLEKVEALKAQRTLSR